MIPKSSVALLLSIHALLVGWVASPNRTEVGHMGATVYFWKTRRFDVFQVNPPLTRVVSGLPVVIGRPRYDWGPYSPRPRDRSEWTLGRAFLVANRPEMVRWCFALDEMETDATPALDVMKQALGPRKDLLWNDKYTVRVINRALNELLGTKNTAP